LIGQIVAKLYFTYAAMNAGKSTALLQSAFNYEERGMRTLLFTASIDNRTSEGQIASRIGLARPARVFDAQTELLDIVKNETGVEAVACVFVDEAQFLSRQHVLDLCAIADDLSIPVMCYGCVPIFVVIFSMVRHGCWPLPMWCAR